MKFEWRNLSYSVNDINKMSIKRTTLHMTKQIVFFPFCEFVFDSSIRLKNFDWIVKLSRFSLRVPISVRLLLSCMSVLPLDAVCWGLWLALRSHDQFLGLSLVNPLPAPPIPSPQGPQVPPISKTVPFRFRFRVSSSV